MKSIILTWAEVEDADKEILRKTNIYKLALNQHAREYKPDAAIITDYTLPHICRNFHGKIISIRDRLRTPSERVEYPDIVFRGSTLIAAVEYLILRQFNEILIIGDNTAGTKDFQKLINKEMENFTPKAIIFQYKKGNFNLSVKTISDFCYKS